MFEQSNESSTRNILSFVLLGSFLCFSAHAVTYTQCSDAWIDAMTSQTAATTPANRARTTIGIGEEVTCSINASTWSDWDRANGTPVQDTIGYRVWGCSPTGTVNPSGSTYSDSTGLTAKKTAGTCTVGVNVFDSEAKFCDSPIYRSIVFTIIEPEMISYSFSHDDVLGWTAWSSGTRYLGAHSWFSVTVNPTSVSFYNVGFQENFGTGETHTWPDGTTWDGPTGVIGPVSPTYANGMGDEQQTGLYNSSKLYNGSTWQDFFPSNSLPWEYVGDTGAVPFYTCGAFRHYYQSSRETQVGVGPSGGAEWGGSMGPWQAP
jgi:hypothetical protein